MTSEPYLYNSTATIYLNRLEHNVRLLKEHIGEGVRQLAVIKADAYGHGAVQVAHFLQDKVDWFAVASMQEAVELRESGIKKDLLIFAPPTVHSGPFYAQLGITAIVGQLSQLDWLDENTSYHLQFDTGMGRFGFYPDEASTVAGVIRDYSGLRLTGIMTHFASADNPIDPSVDEQLKQFHSVRDIFGSDLLYHSANSGGVLFYKDSHFSMVRHGISMYGYRPGDAAVEGLQPVMEWESYLAAVKPIKKGMKVSYHSTWTCPEDGYLGVVPVGYADGYRRNLTGKARMMVEEKSYPVVGIITMDYSMLYLGKDDLKVGTPVTIMDQSRITADDLGSAIGSISYEILCGISKRRVRRVYRDNG
ncbi:MAG TPA: alanine racemase [Balneolales bacterium]|nr:alanine racemase [Balneolales bacterium]